MRSSRLCKAVRQICPVRVLRCSKCYPQSLGVAGGVGELSHTQGGQMSRELAGTWMAGCGTTQLPTRLTIDCWEGNEYRQLKGLLGGMGWYSVMHVE